MEKSNFLKLLKTYLKGEATAEEQQFLIDYYSLFESEPDVAILLNEEQKQSLKDEINTAIWQDIRQKEQVKPHQRLLYVKWGQRISAAAILLIIFSIGIIYITKKIPVQTVEIAQPERKEHRVFRLPDGSTVIVSAGSKLNYPSSFEGLTNREVYLEGQAYFDVRHNAAQPFVVHTGKIKTTVLGTAFNIKAWPFDPDITVTVARGKVKVGDQQNTFGTITPHQQITYNKERAEVVQRTVNASKYLLWKENDLLFDDVTVEEAAELLEERFKVSISINDKAISSSRFTTTFLKDESLEDVLKSICEFSNAQYKYNEERTEVTITTK